MKGIHVRLVLLAALLAAGLLFGERAVHVVVRHVLWSRHSAGVRRPWPPAVGELRLVGEALDAGLRLLRDRELWADVRSPKGIGRGIARTDARGRFELVLPVHDERVEGALTVELWTRESQHTALLRMPWPGRDASVDVGDVALAPPGARELLAPFTYRELEARYRATVDPSVLDVRPHVGVEELWAEMARRGGVRWVAFLDERWREVCSTEPRREEVTLLTALRRCEGLGDPLAVVVDRQRFVTSTPSELRLAVRLVNVDPLGESFTLRHGGNYRSGRFTRCRIEARDAAGVSLPLVPRWGCVGGGLSSLRLLRPGDSIGFQLRLGNYVQIDEPGTYRLRVRYHDAEPIAERPTLDGLLCATSPELTVVVRPR